ncbi:hypothetical protein K533_13965, partial [Salmonella enterica subsp. enterica serovar Cubana str. CVM42234]|uniref:FAD-binding oxidoreductase n=1 Tax=Salmonella enterica TaxID=28901 RepID=UPI0003C80C2D
VRVEAGGVKNQLYQGVKPGGYFFWPGLFTRNPATLGGLIYTQASCSGSLGFVEKAEHVFWLRPSLLKN